MPTIPKQAHTALVLGGGVGGVVAASRLRKLLPRSHRIVLIDRERQQLFQPSLLWVAVGKRKPERIQRPLSRLQRKGIEVVIGDIARIDATRRAVRVNGREFSGDAMIIALGAELAPELVPGLAAAGLNLYTVDGARAVRDALAAFAGGHVV
ncbi:MAG: FAD-dependent oxidoreductase, partial [Gemmatimonadaceae bacterium]